MDKNFATSQGGSVAGFLIIGFILVVLALGGVYFVQQRENSETTKPEAATAGTADKKTNTKTTKPAPVKVVTDGKKSNSSGVQGGTTLPETGPADGLLAVLMSATVVGFSVAYVQSLRYRFASVRR